MMTPGHYLKLRRTAAGLAIVDVAGMLSTEPRIAEHLRAEWLEQIEADVMPATFHTIAALACAYSFDFDVLTNLSLIQLGADIQQRPICRICGCSEADACTDDLGHGCGWADDARTVCTTCAETIS